MSDYLSYKHLLACPYSLSELRFEDDKIVSVQTGDEYPIKNNQPDFRLRREKKTTVDITLNKESKQIYNFSYDLLEKNSKPEVDFSGTTVPYHLSAELISYFPKAKNENAVVLDLGSGTGLHRSICEYAGYRYVAADYESRHAPMLADGHALPFKDNSFDFIISIAVLEHIQHPYVMLKEVLRVLKPGGRFIGTVSFLEPFHDNSYYHHTHLGTFNSLDVAGFDIVKVAPSQGWDGLTAMAYMHMFSTMKPAFLNFCLSPVKLVYGLWWKYKRLRKKPHYHPFTEKYQTLALSGSFAFVADKKISS